MTEKERLIEKLYHGQCSKAELEALLDHLLEHPSEADTAVMEQLWIQMEAFPELETSNATAILERTLSKIEEKDKQARFRKNSAKAGRKQLFTRLSVAATLLLLISVAIWFWKRSPGMIEVKTAYGEQKMLELPDHSQVKLNANSSISFHQQWDEEEDRQVWLEGEAYFEVRKNPERAQKFQVITRDLTVEVLGTVFNVNTRDESTMVFLEEGRVNVELQETHEDIPMVPGELVTYTRETRQPQKRKVETEAPASWKDGTILLEDASLRTIVEKMEEIYGLTTQVDNQTLLDQTFNFPMPVNNLDTAILLLQESTGLEIERMENGLAIR